MWCPHLVEDIKALERVQRKGTKWLLNDYLSQDFFLSISHTNDRFFDIFFCIFSFFETEHHFGPSYARAISTHPTTPSIYLTIVTISIFSTLDVLVILVYYTQINLSHHFYLNNLPRLLNSLISLYRLSIFWNSLVSNIIKLTHFSRPSISLLSFGYQITSSTLYILLSIYIWSLWHLYFHIHITNVYSTLISIKFTDFIQGLFYF